MEMVIKYAAGGSSCCEDRSAIPGAQILLILMYAKHLLVRGTLTIYIPHARNRWFDWSVLLWVCCITFNLGVNVLRRKPGVQYEKYYHVIAWILPFGIALVPLLMGAYGPAGTDVFCSSADLSERKI